MPPPISSTSEPPATQGGDGALAPAAVQAAGRKEADLTLDYLLRRMRFKSDFPALSTSVSRVQAMSQSETDSMQALSDEVLRDVALTQKLLRVVNTAHYRRAGTDPISTVSRAVALIGAGGVRNMALSLMLLDRMQDKAHAYQLRTEFLRTVMAGTLASELSASSKEAEQAYLGALFRNLGRLLVAYYLPDDAEQIRDLCKPGPDGQAGLDERAAAHKVLGVSLDQLADKVGQMWGLPQNLRDCMATPTGDVPKRSVRGRQDHHWWLASLTNDATDCLMHTDPAGLGDALGRLQAQYAGALDLRGEDLQNAAGRARHRMAELTEALNFTVPDNAQAERLVDHFYVDTPQALPTELGTGPDGVPLAPQARGAAASDALLGEQAALSRPPLGAGPLPMAGERAAADGFTDQAYAATTVGAYDGSLSLPEQSAALAAPMPLPDQSVANVLTNGIQDLTNTLLEGYKLNDVLHMILETMYRAMQCQRVLFCLRDPRSNQLLGRMGIGLQVDTIKAVFKVPLSPQPGVAPDLFSVVCLKNADLLIDDANVPSVAPRLPAWFKQQVAAPSFLLLPLTLRRKGQPDVVLGMIYADQARANGFQVRDKELSLLRTLRNQAVMAFKQTTGQ
jgi:HD-like signal output (HDOD) protein